MSIRICGECHIFNGCYASSFCVQLRDEAKQNEVCNDFYEILGNGNSKFTSVKDCGCIECYVHDMARKEKRNCAKFRDANNLPDCRKNFTYRKTESYLRGPIK